MNLPNKIDIGYPFKYEFKVSSKFFISISQMLYGT